MSTTWFVYRSRRGFFAFGWWFAFMRILHSSPVLMTMPMADLVLRKTQPLSMTSLRVSGKVLPCTSTLPLKSYRSRLGSSRTNIAAVDFKPLILQQSSSERGACLLLRFVSPSRAIVSTYAIPSSPLAESNAVSAGMASSRLRRNNVADSYAVPSNLCPLALLVVVFLVVLLIVWLLMLVGLPPPNDSQ